MNSSAIEKIPVNSSFETRASYKHEITSLPANISFILNFFFQCFALGIPSQAAPSLADFVPVLLLWEFVIQLAERAQ